MNTNGVRSVFRLWPIVLGVVLCSLAMESREDLRYGWIPERLLWLAVAIGVVALALSRVSLKGAKGLSGYMMVLFGSIVWISLTHATVLLLNWEPLDLHPPPLLWRVLDVGMVLTTLAAPTLLAVIEGRPAGVSPWIRAVAGVVAGSFAAIAYAPSFASVFVRELGVVPGFTGYHGLQGVGDIQVVTAIAAASGALSVHVVPRRTSP